MTNRYHLLLITLARFPWLCATELQLFLFPTSKVSSRKALTARLLHLAYEEGVVQKVRIDGRHIAYSLSRKGRSQAIDLGLEKVCQPSPIIGNDWRHERYAATALAVLSKGLSECYRSESQLIAHDPSERGRPDGLVKIKDRWFLLEIENAKKSGPHMRRQVGRVETVCVHGEYWCGMHVTGAIIAYPINLPGINHRTRIVNALNGSQLTKLKAVPLILLGFEVKENNPSSIKLYTEENGRLISALHQETGLPPPVQTGQVIGPRRQYHRHELDVVQLDQESATCQYRLNNVLVALDANEQHQIIEAEIWFGGDLVARVHLKCIERETAIEGSLRYLNRLPRDPAGNFLPPANVSRDVLHDVFSHG